MFWYAAKSLLILRDAFLERCKGGSLLSCLLLYIVMVEFWTTWQCCLLASLVRCQIHIIITCIRGSFSEEDDVEVEAVEVLECCCRWGLFWIISGSRVFSDIEGHSGPPIGYVALPLGCHYLNHLLLGFGSWQMPKKTLGSPFSIVHLLAVSKLCLPGEGVFTLKIVCSGTPWRKSCDLHFLDGPHKYGRWNTH